MLALYRKYRPKTLDDLLGQEPIVEILKNAAKQNRLAHAYLFYGQRGSGKTTTARLIAKLANCITRQNDSEFFKKGEPCNNCQACIEIDKGVALDVIEIDAASNRGIDEIRDLKEGVKLSPTTYKYKVFIIDEVHQLTPPAFNALLKTLEEPPAHAIFILATTEYEKVPSTISSRTQRFHFKKIPLPQIIQKLKNICGAEKIEFDESALELIAASSEGSFRDAESLLDQIASLSVGSTNSPFGKISVENVETALSRTGFSKIAEMANYLIEGKLDKALEYLSKINDEGYNLIQFNKDLIHYFRRVLVLKFSPNLEKEFAKIFTDKEMEQIKVHSKKIDSAAGEEKTIKLIKSLIDAYAQMRYSPFAIVPLEIAIVENLKK